MFGYTPTADTTIVHLPHLPHLSHLPPCNQKNRHLGPKTVTYTNAFISHTFGWLWYCPG